VPKPEPTFAHSHQHPHPRANPRPHPHPRPHTTAHLRSALGHAHTHAYTHTDAHNNMPANRAQMHHQYPGLPLPWRPLRTPCVGVPCNSGDFWCVLFVVFCRVVFRPAGDPSFICAKGVYAPNFSMATTSHHTCVSILQNPMNRATCLPAVGDLQCIHNVSRYLNAHSIALCRSKSLLPACSPVFRGTAPDVFQEAVAQATERSHPSTTQRLPTIFTMYSIPLGYFLSGRLGCAADAPQLPNLLPEGFRRVATVVILMAQHRPVRAALCVGPSNLEPWNPAVPLSVLQWNSLSSAVRWQDVGLQKAQGPECASRKPLPQSFVGSS